MSTTLLADLNRLDAEHIQLVALWRQEPVLEKVGELRVPDSLQAAYQQQCKALTINEPVCVLAALPKADPSGTASHRLLTYLESDYATIMTLRRAGQRPMLIAATCMVMDVHQQQFLFQQRSSKNHLYPGYLSVFGGGIHPQQDGAQASQGALRELQEESGHNGHIPPSAWWCLTQEPDNGAVQLTCMPTYINISEHPQFDEAEGKVVRLDWHALQRERQQPLQHWTPLAHLLVEAWFRVGEQQN